MRTPLIKSLLVAAILSTGLQSTMAQFGVAARPVFEDRTARPLRYTPDNGGFVIESAKGKGEFFNRPLYGANTAFRVDAGDLPEFMFYLPNRGGNLRLGIRVGNDDARIKWLHDGDRVIARYFEGMMRYEIHDALLGQGTLTITAVPLNASEGLVLKVEKKNVTGDVELVCALAGSDGVSGSRRGDIGTESLPVTQYFQLRLEGCRGNQAASDGAGFSLKGATRHVAGIFSKPGSGGVGDATLWADAGKLLASTGNPTATPVAITRAALGDEPFYMGVQKVTATAALLNAPALAAAFESAEGSRRAIATAIVVDTPDPFINASAGALCIAADAVWDEAQSAVMHGAVAWRSKLLGWRGPYAMDTLGWHDRMARHLAYWAGQQNTNANPPTEAHADPRKNLATNDWVMLHSEGSMSRSHYDMNLAYIDAYLRHALWTGDVAMLKKTWPMFQRHLAWEQRCFRRPTGPDSLPLYEAYCCIWASDNLQYDGGGVMHASALNYYHNKMAARIATLIGEDGTAYAKEADAVMKAMQRELWLPAQGIYGEFKDLLGPRTVHDSPAVWTYYHAVDSEVPDRFQAYQMSRWIDTNIAHIPIHGANVPAGTSVIASTNWMPYTWSINNVVLGENAGTALADFQAQRPDKGFKLFKGNVLDSMFMGICPGNAHMASYFDTYRTESQRDFADPIAMMTRALVEGVFGVRPDLLAGVITIEPGFPAEWDRASLKHGDFTFAYQRSGTNSLSDSYTIESKFARPAALRMVLTARADRLTAVTVNGAAVQWKQVDDSIGTPRVEIFAPAAARWQVQLTWNGAAPAKNRDAAVVAAGDTLEAQFGSAQIVDITDPQNIFQTAPKAAATPVAAFSGRVGTQLGNHTFFVKLRQGAFSWWSPVNAEIRPAFEILAAKAQDPEHLRFSIRNNTAKPLDETVTIKGTALRLRTLAGKTDELVLPSEGFLPGTNRLSIRLADGRLIEGTVTNWQIALAPAPPSGPAAMEPVDCSAVFNGDIAQIFKAEYLSPRSPYVSLAIPKQGVGGWSSNTTLPVIDDRGLRNVAALNGRLNTPQGVPFVTPSTAGAKNVAFTSFWDNHPKEITIPLTGTARHLYLLMAGTTNPMRSRTLNSEVIVTYADGTTTTLALRNPTTWWPIEQDYMIDDFAFSTGGAPLPPRVDLASGQVRTLDYATFAGKGGTVRGGAALMLDLPLDSRELRSVSVRPSTYQVIIGLMGATLAR